MARVDGAPRGSRVDDLTARVRRRRATRAAHEAAQTLALDERAAVRELVEHTLPWAAAALIPFIVFFESAALRNMVATYDALAYARLFCIAVRRGVLLAFLDSCVDGVTTRVASMALPRDSRR